MPAASPVAGALLPALCSVWDPRRRAPQELSLHARPLSHSHSSPPRLAPPAVQAPFTPRRSPARPGAAPLRPGGVFGVPAGRRCPREEAGWGHRSARRRCRGRAWSLLHGSLGVGGSASCWGCSASCWGCSGSCWGGVVAAAEGAVPAVWRGCSASWHRAIGCSARGGTGGCGVQCQPGRGLWGTVSLAAGAVGCSVGGRGGLCVQCEPGRGCRVQCWLGWGGRGVQRQPGGQTGAAAARAEGFGVRCHQGQGAVGAAPAGQGLWGTPGWGPGAGETHVDRRCLVPPLRDVPCNGDCP